MRRKKHFSLKISLEARYDDNIIQLSDREQEFGDWGDARWAWLLQEPFWLSRPIPAKGMLGLWTMPREIEYQVNQAQSDYARKNPA